MVEMDCNDAVFKGETIMAKKSGNKDYFGLSWIVSLILAIIPITS